MNQDGIGSNGDETDAFVSEFSIALPNLVVSAEDLPETVSSGDQLILRWTTKNESAVPATAPWTERVLLSADDIPGGPDDILLATTNVTSSLLANGTMTRELSARIPFGLQGSYRFVVQLDPFRQLAEDNEGDNNRLFPVEIAYARPPADLVVDGVVAPANAVSGQTVSITWRVTNDGTAATDVTGWSDAIFLSQDDALGGDILIAAVNHTGALAADGSYSQTTQVDLPENLTAGNYYFFVVADQANHVVEPAAEANNFTRAPAVTAITLADVPDLTVKDVVVPSTAVISQPFSITWTTRNGGPEAAPKSWIERVFLSTDGTLTNATLLDEFQHDSDLASSSEITRTETISIPNKPDGDYRIIVVTDATDSVYERASESNNSAVAGQILHLTHPDLIVESILPPSSPESGSLQTIRWTTRNNGTGASSANWSERLFLSVDDQLSDSDTPLGVIARSGTLAPNGTSNGQLEIRLPDGISGSYRIFVRTDSLAQINEGGGESNNDAVSNPFSVVLAQYADLEVSNVTAPDRLIGDPVDLQVSWQVTNVGDGPGRTNNWVDHVILSTDDELGNSDDRLLKEFPHSGAMPKDAQYPRSELISLPAGLRGRFHLFVVTDATEVVYEHSSDGPNSSTPGHVVDVTPTPFADLMVDVVSAPATARSDELLGVTWTVSNEGIGLTNASQWEDEVWISADPNGATGRISLGRYSHVGALGKDSSYTRHIDVPLPANADGPYYVFVSTDASNSAYEFIFDDNNSRRSTDVVNVTHVTPPPVDLLALSVSGPATATDGGGFDVKWTVKNDGPNAIRGEWIDVIYLAPNGNFDLATEIGRFTNSQGLDAGKTYERNERFQFPLRFQGPYQFYVRTDATGVIAETAEINNVIGATGPITVTLHPRPDLQVTKLEIPATVPAGGGVDFKFTVTNLSNTPTPTGGSRWTDAIYLSLDDQFDGGDIILETQDNGSALGIGGAYTSEGSIQLPPAVAGRVYLIARADSTNRVDEFPSENNNTLSQAIDVDATVVPPPDFVVSDVTGPGTTFDSNEIVVHYKVTNRGAGISFPTSWTDTVWLTVDKDRPDPNRGDIRIGTFGHTGALDVNQFYVNDVTVRIPEHTSGQYYLTVWSDAFNAVFEQAFDVNLNPDAPNDFEGSNFKATPLTVLFTPPADLEVTRLVVPPTAHGGEQITIEWSVGNKGTIATDIDRWADAIFISSDPDLHDNQGTQFMVFGVPHFEALEPGRSYSETATFTLPPSAEGSYLIIETNIDPSDIMTEEDFFLGELQNLLQRTEQKLGKPLSDVSLADIQQLDREELLAVLVGSSAPQRVFEGPYGANNQLAKPSTVTSPAPDLIVTSVTPPTQSFSGEPVTISWTVKNQGLGSTWTGTQRWNDYVFVSPDPVLELSNCAGRLF